MSKLINLAQIDKSLKYLDGIISCLLRPKIYRAIKYVTPQLVIKATRKRYNKKICNSTRTIDICLTIGKPNYAERKTIKDLLQVKESFPVKKIQYKLLT